MWFSMRKTLIFEVQLENDYKTNAKRLRYFGTRSLLEREHTFFPPQGCLLDVPLCPGIAKRCTSFALKRPQEAKWAHGRCANSRAPGARRYQIGTQFRNCVGVLFGSYSTQFRNCEGVHFGGYSTQFRNCEGVHFGDYSTQFWNCEGVHFGCFLSLD